MHLIPDPIEFNETLRETVWAIAQQRQSTMVTVFSKWSETDGRRFSRRRIGDVAGESLVLPAMGSLALFSWLLTLHPTASGRVYAAYGRVYIAVALIWLWKVDRVPMTRWDFAGGAIALVGMAIIIWSGRT